MTFKLFGYRIDITQARKIGRPKGSGLSKEQRAKKRKAAYMRQYYRRKKALKALKKVFGTSALPAPTE